MPSNFVDDFDNDDVIEVEHVKQYGKPLNELESGLAHYRVASGSGNPYIVDFQADSDPDVRKHHITTDSFTPIEDRHPLQAGQAIVFKANIDSPANASLQLTLEDGASGTASATFPLHVGDDQVGLEQIKEDQIVMAVYNDNPSRFDVISLGAGGSAGATEMGQLTDVDFSTPPADQDFIQHNGTAFVPKSPAEVRTSLDVPTTSHTHVISDVTTLQASLDAKQNTLTDYTDVPNLSGELTSLGDDISANTTAISGKQDSAPVLAEIAGLDESPSALAKGDMLVHDGTNMQKLPSGSDGQILSANAAAGNGLGVEWSTPMGTGAVDSVFGRTGNVAAASGDYDASEVSDDSGVTSPAGTVAGALNHLNAAISTNSTNIGTNASGISANASALSGKQDTLTGVNDVPGMNVTSLQDGDILQYDSSSSEFKNASLASAGFVDESRTISTSGPLTGGGDLSQDRTISMPAADGVSQDGYLTSAKFAEFDAKEDAANKGQAGGYAGLDGMSGAVPLGQGGTGASTTSEARTNLGLEIGSDVQAHGGLLDSLQGLSGSLSEGHIASDGSGMVLLKSNLNASAAPGSGADFTAGYRVGSLWQWGQRIWRCYGDGEWLELLVRPSGGAEGKILGHDSEGPAWVDVQAERSISELRHNTSGNLTNTSLTRFDASVGIQAGTECVPNTSTDRITVSSTGV